MNPPYELVGILPIRLIGSDLKEVIFLFISEDSPLDPFHITCKFDADGSVHCEASHTDGEGPAFEDMQTLLDMALERSAELLEIIERTLSVACTGDPPYDVR